MDRLAKSAMFVNSAWFLSHKISDWLEHGMERLRCIAITIGAVAGDYRNYMVFENVEKIDR